MPNCNNQISPVGGKLLDGRGGWVRPFLGNNFNRLRTSFDKTIPPALMAIPPTIASQANNTQPSAWTTPLSSAVYVPFFGGRNPGIYTRNNSVYYSGIKDSGLVTTDYMSFNDGYSMWGVHPNSYNWASPIIHTFSTDSVYFGINVSGTGTAVVICDGNYTSSSPISLSGSWLTLSFSTRKMRKFKMVLNGGQIFTGLAVGPTDTVTAANDSGNIKFAMVGDSYMQAAGSMYSAGIGMAVAESLGCSDVCVDAVGETGYQTTGGLKRLIDRLNQSVISMLDVDAILVCAGINDSGNSAGSNAAYITAYYAAVRAAFPSALIVACNAWSAATNNSASYHTAVGKYITPSLQSAGGDWIFIDNLNGGWTTSLETSGYSNGPWQTGTGKVTSPNGTGNCDWYISSDGTHPNIAGVDYLGSRIVSDLKSAVNSICR